MFESHKFYIGLLWVPLHCCTVKQKDPSTDDIVYKGVNEVYVQVDALAKIHKCDVFYTNLRTTNNKVMFFFTYFAFQHVCSIL